MTREEAIETIRMCCPKVGDSQCDFESALRELIPELRESEDERVRMALCDIVRDMPYMETELRAHGLTVEKTIAYLEKQKEISESKAYEILSKKGFVIVERELYNELCDKADKKEQDKCPEYCVRSHCIGCPIYEKQKESLGDFIDDFPYSDEQEEQKPEIKYVYPAFKVGDTIKPKAYNESHRINEIKDGNYVLDNGFTFPIVGQDVWEVVEQKPAEWSEKDERIVSGIYAILEAWDRSHTAPGGLPSLIPEYCLWLENRLKSLRPKPHWKPEGQQLDCLRHMINVSTVGGIDKQLVQDLYEQLKKL